MTDYAGARTFVTGGEISQGEKSTVYKIEEAVFPGLSASLPANANFPKVVDSIVSTLTGKRKDISDEAKTALSEHFLREETRAIISDMFWFCILKMQQEEKVQQLGRRLTTEEDLSRDSRLDLLKRMSNNYIELFMQIRQEDKDFLMGKFYTAVAQGVFCSMFFAFPKSRSKINNETVKRKVYGYVGKYVAGMQFSGQGYNKWNLNLGHGNELDKHKKVDKDVSFHSVSTASTKGIERKLTPMRYSPLANRYISSRKYQAKNQVPNWKIRYTHRNYEREQDVDRKFSQFRHLVVETEKKMKKRMKQLEDFKRERLAVGSDKKNEIARKNRLSTRKKIDK